MRRARQGYRPPGRDEMRRLVIEGRWRTLILSLGRSLRDLEYRICWLASLALLRVSPPEAQEEAEADPYADA